MRLKYLGHAAFELSLGDGRKIVFDPYEAGSYDGAVMFDPIEGRYDIAVVSHDHPDHASAVVIASADRVVDSAGETEIDGIKVASFPVFHDETKGSERGKTLISIVETEGIRIAHLGDLGHMITMEDLPALGGLDVAMIPVGGHFTIDAEVAAAIVDLFKPKIVIPMHFKTEKLGFPIDAVDGFISLMDNVEVTGGSELEISSETLSGSSKVVVLEPAL